MSNHPFLIQNSSAKVLAKLSQAPAADDPSAAVAATAEDKGTSDEDSDYDKELEGKDDAVAKLFGAPTGAAKAGAGSKAAPKAKAGSKEAPKAPLAVKAAQTGAASVSQKTRRQGDPAATATTAASRHQPCNGKPKAKNKKTAVGGHWKEVQEAAAVAALSVKVEALRHFGEPVDMLVAKAVATAQTVEKKRQREAQTLLGLLEAKVANKFWRASASDELMARALEEKEVVAAVFKMCKGFCQTSMGSPPGLLRIPRRLQGQAWHRRALAFLVP